MFRAMTFQDHTSKTVQRRSFVSSMFLSTNASSKLFTILSENYYQLPRTNVASENLSVLLSDRPNCHTQSCTTMLAAPSSSQIIQSTKNQLNQTSSLKSYLLRRMYQTGKQVIALTLRSRSVRFCWEQVTMLTQFMELLQKVSRPKTSL